MRLKNYLKSKLLWFLLILIVVLIRVIVGYFSDATKKYIASTVKNTTEEIITDVINEGIIVECGKLELFDLHFDSNGKVTYASLDSYEVIKVKNSVSRSMEDIINKINTQQYFENIKIPFGYLLGFGFTYGIMVPFQIKAISNYNSNIRTEVVAKGLNTTFTEIILDVEITFETLIPYRSIPISDKVSIPLALEVMNNEIPYYLGDIFK